MQIEELREFFNKQKWTYAKTYADRAPHEYIVRHKHVGEDEEFMEVLKHISENGITMYFWNRPNKYIFLDGHQYWVMKDSEDDPTAVLNRCNLEEYKITVSWRGKGSSKIDEYMKKPYRMVVVQDEEGIFTLSFPDLPGCITTGVSAESVVANARDAKREWFRACLEEGKEIPEPSEDMGDTQKW